MTRPAGTSDRWSGWAHLTGQQDSRGEVKKNGGRRGGGGEEGGVVPESDQ